LPEWEKSLEFSRSVKGAWQEYLQKYFAGDLLKIEDYEEDMQVQSQSWDLALLFNGKYPILRVELKTRQEWVYDIFQKDSLILIETQGNVDKNSGGSAIYFSNAELWCYGFFSNGYIIKGFLFKRKELAIWLKNNEGNFEKKYSNTDQLYKTEFILIPIEEIEQFIFHLRPSHMEVFF